MNEIDEVNEIDEKNEIYAGRIKDSLGEYSQFPIFKQGQDEVRPDSLRYNMDSKKAIIFNSRTEESGLNIISDKKPPKHDPGSINVTNDLEVKSILFKVLFHKCFISLMNQLELYL